jgi:hypothetical protein
MFPARVPIGLLLGVVLAVGSGLASFGVWRHMQPTLQAFYLRQYITSGLGAKVQAVAKRSSPKPFFLVTVNGFPATPETIRMAPRTSVSGRYVFVPPAWFHAQLRNTIYSGRSVVQLVKPVFLVWGVLSFLSLAGGLAYDFRRRKRAREGDPLRGPRRLTWRQYNRSKKGDGLVIRLA